MVIDSPTRKKILFVDDEDSWREKVSASLTEAGYDVLAARNASEAMLRADMPSLGLILVDDDLAGESGILLTKFLRANHPGVPTMLYTSKDYDDATILSMAKQGIDRCLPKGGMDELIVTVGGYIR
jgi:DNA-binding response OmpR family regulator